MQTDHSNVPVSAPPVPIPSVDDETKVYPIVETEPQEVQISPVDLQVSTGSVKAVVQYGPGVQIFGRVNLILGGRGSEQSMVQGVIEELSRFQVRRDELLRVISTPVPMRVGYIEFIAAPEEEVTGEVGVGYTVMYISQESIIGIGVEMFQGAADYLTPARLISVVED